MNINEAGLDLIKTFEGCSLVAYQDVAGIWTIGFGHTADVTPGMTITADQANAFLEQDVQETCQVLTKLFEVPVTDNQFSACVSLAYNIGCGAFARSTALRMINEKQPPEICAEWILVWDKASVNGVEQTVPGLLRRREAEKALFLT